jgi:hypothetical protein
MVERRRRTSFLLETSKAILIVRERRRQDFQCDVASQARVARAEHFAHASRAKDADDLVRPEVCS